MSPAALIEEYAVAHVEAIHGRRVGYEVARRYLARYAWLRIVEPAPLPEPPPLAPLVVPGSTWQEPHGPGARRRGHPNPYHRLGHPRR